MKVTQPGPVATFQVMPSVAIIEYPIILSDDGCKIGIAIRMMKVMALQHAQHHLMGICRHVSKNKRISKHTFPSLRRWKSEYTFDALDEAICAFHIVWVCFIHRASEKGATRCRHRHAADQYVAA